MKVCVVMSTYNGNKYIREQLDSILKQTIDDLHIFVRDDQSSDDTLAILEEYNKLDKVTYMQGENQGAAKSFLVALSNAPQADYYAFADQDDIWETDKLAVAIQKISEEEHSYPDSPVLYHSRVKITDAYGNVVGINGDYEARGFLRGEKRAIIGCSVVINKTLRDKIVGYRPDAIIMHDAWIHDVCLALDGRIVYDKHPHIFYRQHQSNQVGGSKGLFNAIKRRIKYYKKRPVGINKMMLTELLMGYQEQMKPEYVHRAKILIEYDQSIKNTIRVLKDGDYFRGRIWWKMEQIFLILCHRY